MAVDNRRRIGTCHRGWLVAFPKIKQARAFVVGEGGANYHDQDAVPWVENGFGVVLNRDIERPYPR